MEGVISQIKLFNAGSGWRTLTCVGKEEKEDSSERLWEGSGV